MILTQNSLRTGNQVNAAAAAAIDRSLTFGTERRFYFGYSNTSISPFASLSTLSAFSVWGQIRLTSPCDLTGLSIESTTILPKPWMNPWTFLLVLVRLFCVAWKQLASLFFIDEQTLDKSLCILFGNSQIE